MGWYISVTSHIQIGLITLDSSSIKDFIQHPSTYSPSTSVNLEFSMYGKHLALFHAHRTPMSWDTNLSISQHGLTCWTLFPSSDAHGDACQDICHLVMTAQSRGDVVNASFRYPLPVVHTTLAQRQALAKISVRAMPSGDRKDVLNRGNQ